MTQFESTEARRCFPCWDEPAVKSTFSVSIIAPEDRVVLSNMPVTSTSNPDLDSLSQNEVTPGLFDDGPSPAAMAALGGAWWPIEITPAWMQALQEAVPAGWTMDAMHRLISFGDAPASILPHFIALVLAALAIAWAAARAFKFD